MPHPSFIGVAIACGGNLLISLALNCQKLAHKRIEEQASQYTPTSTTSTSSSTQTPKPTTHSDSDPGPCTFPSSTASSSQSNLAKNENLPIIYIEPATPIPGLTPDPEADEHVRRSGFGPPIDLPSNLSSASSAKANARTGTGGHPPITKIKDVRRVGRTELGRGDPAVYKQDLSEGAEGPVLIGLPDGETLDLSEERLSDSRSPDEDDDLENQGKANNDEIAGPETETETDTEQTPPPKEVYLKSKLWWSGLLLMSIGEGGNFLSYGFAPASVVAPLGTVALIANCFLSPLMLGERFEWKDLLGVALAILGAVTVVLSAKTSNPSLSPRTLLIAIEQPVFIAYTVVIVAAILGLLTLTHSKRFGGRWLGVDLGLCALFGGYTVLSTKALSSLVSRLFFDAFRYPITWVLVIILAGTSVLQIRYLNRALMEFESKEVIPTQFVFFSISAIVGSAVLYQEFRDVTVSRLANFLFGIMTTFVGVFLLTAKTKSGDDADVEDIEVLDRNEEQEEQAVHANPLTLHSRRSSLKSHRSQLSPIAERAVLIPSRPLRAPDKHYNSLVFPGKHAMRKRSSTATLSQRGISSGGFLLLATSPSASGMQAGARSRSPSRAGQLEAGGRSYSPA